MIERKWKIVSGRAGSSGTANADASAPRTESAIVICSARGRPRQSPTYPSVSCPTIAPTRHAVDAIETAPDDDAVEPPVYWFSTSTWTTLITSRLYAVLRLETAEMTKFLESFIFLLAAAWHDGASDRTWPRARASRGPRAAPQPARRAHDASCTVRALQLLQLAPGSHISRTYGHTQPDQPTSDFSCRFLSVFPHVPNTPMCGLCVTVRFRAALSFAFFSRTFSTSSMLSAWQSQPCLS